MKLPIDPSYPIANLSQILSRANLDLSPIELAEILWLAVQRGEIVVTEKTPQQQSESIELPPQIEPPPNIQPEASEMPPQPQPEVNVDIVAEPPQNPPEAEIIEPAPTPLPVKIPEAVALRNRREIAKVLRPLMRKVPSRTRQAIDEEATAMRIAEDKIWNPVVKPEPERWLELAIVIEVTNLFDVWHDSISEFQQLMERHGAFRDVRAWQLQTPENGEPQLFLQTATGLNCKPRNPKELLDAGGRRLVLFLSDCTSKAWRSGRVFPLLELWSRQNPVTIAQLLPERYWDRSALGSGYLVALRSQLLGARSRDWQVSGLSPRRRQRLHGGLKFPVVTIQPHSLGEWARAMAATGEQQTVGIVLKPDTFQIERVPELGAEPLTAKQLVHRFRGTASAKAQELADMMAVLPVNWSVLRLLQKNLMQGIEDPAEGTGALYLAEIFLSGLLSLVDDNVQNLKSTQQYNFVEGVRSVLLGGVPILEAREIGEEIATAIFQQLPTDVQERVNADIARRWGESLSYFEAFLLPNLPWGEDTAAEMLPFAQASGEVLRRWGGKYAALAERLEQTTAIQSPQSIDKEQPDPISWQDIEFEVVTVEFSEYPPLEPFNFEVATLTISQLELEDVFRIANTAIKSRTREELTALQQEIIEGTWKKLSYAKIADLEGLSKGHVSRVGATLFNSLSEELRSSISKKNMVEVFGRLASKPTQSEIKIDRSSGQAYQFIEPLSNEIVLEMVKIPAGEFLMGSPEDEPEEAGRTWRSTQRPQHLVTVPEFYFSKYTITQAQWRVVADLPSVQRELELDPSEFKGDNLPVETVSWLDAVEFCERLSNLTGRKYRLPSEAEWEYACRAGTTTSFHFGNKISTDLANYNGDPKNYGCKNPYTQASEGICRSRTTPVGSFNAANAFGLSDMHGNVGEWCLDNRHYINMNNYEGAPTDGSAWNWGNQTIIIRGGGWIWSPEDCRSAYRSSDPDPDKKGSSSGFRVVCKSIRTL